MSDNDLGKAIKEMLEEASKVRRYDILTPVDDDLLLIKKEVLGGKVRDLQRLYGDQLSGTPEADYLYSLLEYYTSNTSTEQDQNLYKTVDELDLSIRSLNCLQNAGIKYVGELVQQNEAHLLGTKCLGKKSLCEIKEVLAEMGLRLGTKSNFVPPYQK